MRISRASRSCKRRYTGSSVGVIVLQPASTPKATIPMGRTRYELLTAGSSRFAPFPRCLLPVDDLDPAIQAVSFLVAAERGRPLLALTHRAHLLRGSALQHQDATNRLRSPLPETDIVLARAALVGVPFEPDSGIRIRREIARVRREHVVVLRGNVAAVELEVDDQLVEQIRRCADAGLENVETAAVAERARGGAARILPGRGTRLENGKRVAAVTTGQRQCEDASEQRAGSKHVPDPQGWSVYKNLRIVVNAIPASRPRERPPHRLTHVADSRFDALLDVPVARDRPEHAPSPFARREDQERTVRRVARRLVELSATTQHAEELVVREVERRDPEISLRVVAAMHDREKPAVRRDTRAGVVVPVKRHALRCGTGVRIRRDAIDLRRPAAIGHEVDRLAVRRPRG